MLKADMAKSIISREQLKIIYANISEDLNHLFELFAKNQLQPYEVAGLYILLFYFKFNSKNWKGAQKKAPANVPNSIFLQDVFPRWSNFLIQPIKLLDFFATVRLKQIPESAHISLLKWAQGEYPLILKTHIPNALEVLHFQTKNQRIVTVLSEPSQLNLYVLDERDPMSFVIHDLVHAAHFFADPEVRSEQLGFYIKMSNAYNSGCFADYSSDIQFRKDFEYLISDMNSVSLHLMMSFKTILIHAYLRKHKLPISHRMNSNLKTQFELEFQQILVSWNIPKSQWHYFLRMNEQHFCKNIDGNFISNYFKKTPTSELLLTSF